MTKGATPERPGKSTRAGVRYTAHIGWTTTTELDGISAPRGKRPGEANPESRMLCPGRCTASFAHLARIDQAAVVDETPLESSNRSMGMVVTIMLKIRRDSLSQR